MHSSFQQNERGISLLETLFALGILTIVFLGTFAVSGRVGNLVRKSEANADAQRNCMARIDQLRTLGWANVTNPTSLATLLVTRTGDTTFAREVIAVYEAAVPQTLPVPSPAPAATPAPSTTPLFTVTKVGAAPPVIAPLGFDASTTLARPMLNYRVLTEWNRFGRVQQREVSTVISRSATR
jgi:type II secretory pathway pseudopilin PulG